MVRRLATLIGALSIGLVSFCSHPLPAFPQVQSQIFIPSASATATGTMASGDIGGQSVCRFNLSGTWSGVVKATVQSVGGSVAEYVPLFNDNNVEYTSGVGFNGDFVFYPQSGGTVSLYVSVYTSGTIQENGVNCTPAVVGHPNTDALGNQVVSFSSAQPISVVVGPTPIPVLTPIPLVLPTDAAGRLSVTTPSPLPTDAFGRISVTTPSPNPTDASGRLAVTTPSPLPTDAAGRVSVSTPAPVASIYVSNYALFPTPSPLPTDAAGRVAVTTPSPLPTDAAGRVSVSTPAPVATIFVSNYSLFPTPSPLPTDGLGRILVSTPAPVATIYVSNYASFPTPIPTIAPAPLPTASAGATPPGTAQWTQSIENCQYNGNGVLTASQATPAPTQGNVIPCQANQDGSQLTSNPMINSYAVASGNGTFLTTFLDGENTCRLRMIPTGGSTATINVDDNVTASFAGPYAVSGSTTATFQLATNSYVVVDTLSIAVTSFTGTGQIQLRLTCGIANSAVYQGGGIPWSFTTPYTVASPLPVSTPAPFQSYSGNILKTIATDTGGTAYTYASPMPVVTPGSVGITGTVNVAPASATLPVSGTVTANQGTSPWVVTTPAPAPTVAAGYLAVQQQGALTANVNINAAQSVSVSNASAFPTPIPWTTASPQPVSTPSAAPEPTASAGAAPPANVPVLGAQMYCYFASGQTSITATNVYAAKCDKVGDVSTSSAGHSNVIASAAVSTCTAVATGPELLVDIIYANASAQTGTLEIFNEGASPTCAAGDLIWVSVNHAAGGMDLINHLAMAGIAYEWITNAQASGGKVLIDTNP